MFWLSYESFSILSNVFCQKSVISSENSCKLAKIIHLLWNGCTRCWRKLINVKETFHNYLAATVVMISRDISIMSKGIKKKVFFRYGFLRVQSPTCNICHEHHLKKRMIVQTLLHSYLSGTLKILSFWDFFVLQQPFEL